MRGEIVYVASDRGFGFVRPEGGTREDDHFFHQRDSKGLTFTQQLAHQTVEFDSTRSARGLAAVNVRLAD